MFKNKVVIVTGASAGIGETTAIHFSKEGANIVIVGRNEERLKKVEAECTKFGPKPLVINADVSKEDETSKIIEKTIDKFGKIDVLVNNAGILRTGTIQDGKLLSSFDAVIKTNLRPVLHLTALAAPYLIKTKGNIVNISSVAGVKIVPGFISYCISKAGMDHFTKGAAQELASFGVRVNSVNPGPVRTDIFKVSDMPSYNENTWDEFSAKTGLRRISEPEEIADLILFVASDKAKSITGSIYFCDNGYCVKDN